MAKIKNKNLRFYLDNPTHKKAWDFLRNIDKSQHGSCNNVIVTAIVDYFENQQREERFISKIAELIMNTSTRPNPQFIANPPNPPTVQSDEVISEHIDFDFVGG